MNYRTLGRTNLRASVVGIGTTQLRRVPEREAVTILRRAFDLGINIVNSGPDYEGAYDLILNALLETDCRREVLLTFQSGGAVADFERTFEATCHKFDTGRLDLFGIAAISDQEAFGVNVWGKGGLVEFLQKKKEEGRIRGVYASDHGSPEQMKRMLERDVFDALMLAWNPLGFHLISFRPETVWKLETPPLPIRRPYEWENIPRTAREILPMAQARDVGILVMKPLAGGLLTPSKAFPRHDWRESFPDSPSAPEVLRYLLMNEAVASVVVGTASVEEAEENARAGDLGKSLDRAAIGRVERRSAALCKVLCSRCGACDDLCSRGLPVSFLFRAAYNYLVPSAPFEISSGLQYFKLHPREESSCATCEDRTCRCAAGIDIPGELIAIHRKMLDLRDQGLVPLRDQGTEDWSAGLPYAAKVLTREMPGELRPGETTTVRLHLRNTGSHPWYREKERDHSPVELAVFLDGARVATERLRHDVYPAGSCHFAFGFRAPLEPGAHELRLALSAGDGGHFPGAARAHVFGVAAPPDRREAARRRPHPLAARYVDHNVPAECAAGARAVFRVCVENTGTRQWKRSAPDGHDAALALFIDGKVVASGKSIQETVAPGERAVIAVAVDLPDAPGSHDFRFDLMLCNKTWFSQAGVPPLEIPVRLVARTKTRTERLLEASRKHNSWAFSPGLGVHRTRRGAPRFPIFAETAKGCRIRDVDDVEFVDVHMGWGCCLLGYSEARIQAAVADSLVNSGIQSLIHRLEIEVSEALCGPFGFGDEVLFGKNGSDATTWAARTARVATGRKTILCSGYHGWQDWFAARLESASAGIPPESGRYTVPLVYRDVPSLETAVRRHRRDLAAIMIEPAATAIYFDDPLHETDGPYLRRAEELARRHGALFILDEIMTGFRFRGGSAQEHFGLTPDLTCLGKALSNGLPLSALVGRSGVLRRSLDRIAYWPTNKGEVHSFAAAREALRLYREDNVPRRIEDIGERIRDGVRSICRDLGLDAGLVGPPYRMYFGFFDLKDEQERVLCRTLLQQELARGGVISHRGFVIPSLGHDDAGVDAVIRGFASALRTIGAALESGLPVRYFDIPDVAEEKGSAPFVRRGTAVPPRYPIAKLRSEIQAGRTHLESGPTTINIELTGRCNVKPACVFCVGKNENGYREPGDLGDGRLEAYWPWLYASRRVNDCSFGEPWLYPRLEELIGRLASARVKFGFTSNGLLLNDARARFLIDRIPWIDMCVSVNAATPETYSSLHGQDFAALVGNLERFSELHRKLRPDSANPLVLSFIVMRSNRHELFDFLRLARRIGARCVILRHLFDLHRDDFSTDQFGSNYEYGRERLSYDEYRSIEEIVRLEPEFAEMDIHYEWNTAESFIAEQAEPGVDIPCLFPWKFLCIRPIHDMYIPCVFVKKGVAAPSRSTVAEVWNGGVMGEMRRSLAKGEVPEFCMANGDACPVVLEQRARGHPLGYVLSRGR